MGLCAFSQAGFGEFFNSLVHVRLRRGSGIRTSTYIFSAILINCYVNSTKRATTNLLLDGVLVDPMLSTPIVLTGHIFRTRIECFLFSWVSGARSRNKSLQ